jgi:hypothetical protein
VTAPADPLAELDDYTSGVMPDAEAEAFEAELFARAAQEAAPEADFLERLRRAAGWIARRGNFSVGTTRAQIDLLLAGNLRTLFMDFGDSGSVEIPPLPPDLELFTYRLGVDLRGHDLVDVVVETPDGQEVKIFRDVRPDPNDGALYGVCEAPLAEISFRRGVVISKIMAGQGAERRLVASFETRPTPPAPAR